MAIGRLDTHQGGGRRRISSIEAGEFDVSETGVVPQRAVGRSRAYGGIFPEGLFLVLSGLEIAKRLANSAEMR